MKTEKKATRTTRSAKKLVAKAATPLGSVTSKNLPAKDPSETMQSRRTMIEQAAYFKAVQDGFRVDALAYWLAAEKEVDASLSAAS